MAYPLTAVTPMWATRDPAVFAEMLLYRPRTRTVRVGVLDDSQSVNTDHYNRHLNAAFCARHGNCPETPVYVISGPPTNANTEARWLVSTLKPDSVTSGTTASYIPPGLSSAGHRSGSIGFYSTLQPDCINAGSSATLDKYIARTAPPYYFNRGGNLASAKVDVDVFAFTNASSGEMIVDAMPTTSSVGEDAGAAVTASFTTALTLQDAALSLKRATYTLPYSAGNPYMQCRLRGSDAVKYTQVCGVRFRSRVSPQGVACTPLAVAGYKASSFLLFHANCSQALATLGMDGFLHGYGHNDAGEGVTPDQFGTNTEANIDFVDAAYAAAGLRLPFHVLRADACAADLSADNAAIADQYPAVLAKIAATRRRCLAVNSRRLTIDAGWTVAAAGDFTVDGIHYNALGGQVMGRADEYLIHAAAAAEPFVEYSSSIRPVAVDHNTGGADNLRYVHAGSGIAGATVRAYLKTDYDAGQYAERGRATTKSDGRWAAPMYLDGGFTYTFTFSKPDLYTTSVKEQAV